LPLRPAAQVGLIEREGVNEGREGRGERGGMEEGEGREEREGMKWRLEGRKEGRED